MKGSFTQAMKLGEPERTKFIAKEISLTKTYPVVNPGAAIPVMYQGEKLVVEPGVQEYPDQFAYYLLCKFNFLKSPFDKSKKTLHDGREPLPGEPQAEVKPDFIETFPEVIPDYDDITANELKAWLKYLDTEVPEKATKKALYEQLEALGKSEDEPEG